MPSNPHALPSADASPCPPPPAPPRRAAQAIGTALGAALGWLPADARAAHSDFTGLGYALLRQTHADLERLETEAATHIAAAEASLDAATRSIGTLRTTRPNLPTADTELVALRRQCEEARKQLGKLHVYGGAEHPHAAQKPVTVDFKSKNRKNSRIG